MDGAIASTELLFWCMTFLARLSAKGVASGARRLTMAQDGCQRPAWTGQAFSYLPHGPSKPAQSGAEGALPWHMHRCAAVRNPCVLFIEDASVSENLAGLHWLTSVRLLEHMYHHTQTGGEKV